MNFQNIVREIDNKLVCTYQNKTDSWQIVKITNIPELYLEKVVLPRQTIIFEASPKAQLKVFSTQGVTTVLQDIITCKKLLSSY